jgi:hypothetical protein
MLCPSRGRPHAAAELAAAWPGLTGADAELVFLLDDDDPALPGYWDLPLPTPGLVRQVVGPPARVGPWLNRTAPRLAAEGTAAVGFLGDDHRPRTPGWDVRFLKALEEIGGGVVYGNDQFQAGRLPTAVAISSWIIAELGYMTPPGLEHLYLDNFWAHLGGQLGRLVYLPDVVIEHLHPLAGKGHWDPGYERVNHPDQYARDAMALRRFLDGQFAADLERLRARLAAVP